VWSINFIIKNKQGEYLWEADWFNFSEHNVGSGIWGIAEGARQERRRRILQGIEASITEDEFF